MVPTTSGPPVRADPDVGAVRAVAADGDQGDHAPGQRCAGGGQDRPTAMAADVSCTPTHSTALTNHSHAR